MKKLLCSYFSDLLKLPGLRGLFFFNSYKFMYCIWEMRNMDVIGRLWGDTLISCDWVDKKTNRLRRWCDLLSCAVTPAYGGLACIIRLATNRKKKGNLEVRKEVIQMNFGRNRRTRKCKLCVSNIDGYSKVKDNM